MLKKAENCDELLDVTLATIDSSEPADMYLLQLRILLKTWKITVNLPMYLLQLRILLQIVKRITKLKFDKRRMLEKVENFDELPDVTLSIIDTFATVTKS